MYILLFDINFYFYCFKDWKLDAENKIEIDGWEWCDEEPVGYLDYLAEQAIQYGHVGPTGSQYL